MTMATGGKRRIVPRLAGRTGWVAGWQLLALCLLLAALLIFLAGYAASSRVEIVQFIATGRTGSISQYTGCEATDPITLPPITIVAPNAVGDVAITDSSRMRIAANVTADYRATSSGLEIFLRQGIDGDLLDNWEQMSAAPPKPVATIDTGSQVRELPSGSRILIATDTNDFTVASRGAIEIGGLNGQTGAGARLSSEAQVTAIESPYIGSERIRFVDEKVEQFSIIYSHPELIVADDAQSGGYRKTYDKLLSADCADPGADRRQPLAFFAFGTSADEDTGATQLAVSMMRRTDAIGLATMGEVTPVSGLPKLIQVSSWSRVVKSPALQAAFAMAATLVTIGGLIASILALRKEDSDEEQPLASPAAPKAGPPNPPAPKPRRQPARKAEPKSRTKEP